METNTTLINGGGTLSKVGSVGGVVSGGVPPGARVHHVAVLTRGSQLAQMVRLHVTLCCARALELVVAAMIDNNYNYNYNNQISTDWQILILQNVSKEIKHIVKLDQDDSFIKSERQQDYVDQ